MPGLLRGSADVSGGSRVQRPTAGLPSAAARTASPDETLRTLARKLAEAETPAQSAAAYRELLEFAGHHATQPAGQRAALVLGHYDFEKKRFVEARAWLAAARHDALLRPYALYWHALAERALGRTAAALSALEALRREFPASVPAELVGSDLAALALAVGRPAQALEALAVHPKLAATPSLLLLRGRALAAAGRRSESVELFSEIYFGHPLSAAAKDARHHLASAAFKESSAPATRRIARANTFYDARRWREARAEFSRLLPALSAAERGPALLRIAQCRAQIEKRPAALESLHVTLPELDAERLVSLAAAYRSRRRETQMLEALERVVAGHPQSPWAEEALLAAGNHFWSKLDRRRAAAYYQRLCRLFPAAAHAQFAHWRMAWVTYLEGARESRELLESHLQRFPGTPLTPNALYWSGRTAERAGDFPRARGFYAKLLQRHPQNYFGLAAARRLHEIGPSPVTEADVLALIRPAAPLAVQAAIPAPALAGWDRAQALRSIGFHASAELELRAVHAEHPSPRLLFEAGLAAIQAGRLLPGIAAARQAVPQLEGRRLADVPEEVWRAVYPLEFRDAIEAHATRAGLDPMMVAALIRQESVFQPRAVSRAGARGLMQLYPPTGRILARREKLRYSRARLFDPAYNLRLGTVYLADLYRTLGAWEPALAAYNAGEHRVAQWQAERAYNEPAEFVESIPFTETREYVQIVMRNAEIYRALYGKTLSAGTAAGSR